MTASSEVASQGGSEAFINKRACDSGTDSRTMFSHPWASHALSSRSTKGRSPSFKRSSDLPTRSWLVIAMVCLFLPEHTVWPFRLAHAAMMNHSQQRGLGWFGRRSFGADEASDFRPALDQAIV